MEALNEKNIEKPRTNYSDSVDPDTAWEGIGRRDLDQEYQLKKRSVGKVTNAVKIKSEGLEFLVEALIRYASGQHPEDFKAVRCFDLLPRRHQRASVAIALRPHLRELLNAHESFFERMAFVERFIGFRMGVELKNYTADDLAQVTRWLETAHEDFTEEEAKAALYYTQKIKI